MPEFWYKKYFLLFILYFCLKEIEKQLEPKNPNYCGFSVTVLEFIHFDKLKFFEHKGQIFLYIVKL